MRRPAALPADEGGKVAHLKPPVRSIDEGMQHVVTGQRQRTIDLKLSIHLIVHP